MSLTCWLHATYMLVTCHLHALFMPQCQCQHGIDCVSLSHYMQSVYLFCIICTSTDCLQAGTAQRMLNQQDVLKQVLWTLADVRRLIDAVSQVEGNAAAKTHLQVGISCFARMA